MSRVLEQQTRSGTRPCVRQVPEIDTDCATQHRRPALLPDCCAMIFRSKGRLAVFLSLSRVAGRSTPMMGFDRSNLSCRTILFLVVMMGMPMAARSDTLEDSAKELARKVAAALSTSDRASIEVRNTSSLATNEALSVEKSFRDDMQNLGIRFAADSADAVHVRITFSENIKNFLWSAEISGRDAPKVILLMVPRSSEDRIVSSTMPMALRSEKFWEGPQRILDATLANFLDSGSSLLLLTPDALESSTVGSDTAAIIKIPQSQFVNRDPTGDVVLEGNKVVARSAQQICRIDLQTRALVECHPVEGPPGGTVYEKIDFATPAYVHVERGSQSAKVQSTCRGGELYLAAGSGDYTVPDTIQLFESSLVNGIIVEKRLSDFLHFPGPVTALRSADGFTRAIVRNLRTGNYEAYRISITCGE